MKRIPALLLAFAWLLLCIPASAEGNIMKFDTTVGRVFEGETLQTVLIREGAPAEGEVTYEASNRKVAEVDSRGVITGLNKGQTTITASVKTEKKTFRAQMTVTVARKAASVEVNTEKLPVYSASDVLVSGLLQPLEAEEENEVPVLVLPVKRNYELRVTVLPKDATNRRATVTSDNPDIVRARGTSIYGMAPGEATVTVANELSPEVCVQYRVLVVQPLTRIALSLPEKSVAAGEQISVSASLLPDDASIPQLVWSSANPEIAVVDENGTVTGVARGNARIVASAADGSNVRANISVRVTQKAEQILLDRQEVTVDTGRSTALKATVLPKNADNKNVIWTSSDEAVATVSNNGRITAKALGDCEIVCTSAENGEVTATAAVHVQQPVTRIVFDGEISVFAGEDGKVAWTVQPDNATHPEVTLTSSKPNILSVDPDGTVHGLAKGEAFVRALSTDGSNRQAQVRVRVLQHVTGVRMKRRTAYVDVNETNAAHAILEPNNASIQNVLFSVDDESIAKIRSKGNCVNITGVSKGETVVRGVTEDGGYETSIAVKVGDWNKALQFKSFEWDKKGAFALRVKNNSELTITEITAEIRMFDASPDAGNAPIPINTKDGSHVVTAVWRKTLLPGEETSLRNPWKMINYKAPADMDVTRGTVTILSYQIDDDWIKTIREKRRPFQDW
ncbi:MAG: Ig-like domain-containing protein [Clostridia bacterium]|nr:Ig-like domain-containing protein [Clostridia bacterium]